MVIDCHVHLIRRGNVSNVLKDWFVKNTTFKEGIVGVGEVLKEMDSSGIDKSIIFPIPYEDNYLETNDYMAKIQMENKDRFICFGTINPKDIKNSIIEITRMKMQLNLKGIKLHPSIQSFFPNEKKYFKIYEAAEKNNLPIIFHVGFGGLNPLPDKYSHPILLDDIACEFNNLKIIIAHGGRYYFKETAMLIRKHPNIYTEISTNIPKIICEDGIQNLLLYKLLETVKSLNGSLNKVFYGSDFPFRGMKETIDLLKSIPSSNFNNFSIISEEEIENVLNQNLIKSFKFE